MYEVHVWVCPDIIDEVLCFVSRFVLPWLLTALWCAGGLGEAVAGALSEELNIRVHRLAVTGIPRSGLCHELLELYGISSAHIIKAVKSMI